MLGFSIPRRRNAREATAATTSSSTVSRREPREKGGRGEGGRLYERSARSSHKQLVASAKLPRLLQRSSNSSLSCAVRLGYTTYLARMGLGRRKYA